MKNIIFVIPLLFLLGCESSSSVGVDVTVNPLENLNISHPPKPLSVEMRNIEWVVITSENKDEHFESPLAVYYGITPEDYEKLALNFAELRRYILSQKANSEYYQRVLDRFQESIKAIKND